MTATRQITDSPGADPRPRALAENLLYPHSTLRQPEGLDHMTQRPRAFAAAQRELYSLPRQTKGSLMHYELQKAMQRELNERIPPAPKGDPQNEFRHVVNSHRLCGKTFDQSVSIATNLIRTRYPHFAPRILPPR